LVTTLIGVAAEAQILGRQAVQDVSLVTDMISNVVHERDAIAGALARVLDGESRADLVCVALAMGGQYVAAMTATMTVSTFMTATMLVTTMVVSLATVPSIVPLAVSTFMTARLLVTAMLLAMT